MSNLIKHAERELKKAGLFDKDADYGGATAASVMQLIRVFSKQRHSGGSAALVRALFHALSAFEPLTPLTNDPKEWEDRTELNGGSPLWQNTRDSRMMSTDGGKTYWNVEEQEKDKPPKLYKSKRA